MPIQDPRCPKCNADLSEVQSVSYLSGDTLQCHIDVDEIVRDSEGECDSSIVCTRCGTSVVHLVRVNRIWE